MVTAHTIGKSSHVNIQERSKKKINKIDVIIFIYKIIKYIWRGIISNIGYKTMIEITDIGLAKEYVA